MKNFDVIVIGQGFSGLMAAGLAADCGLKTVNIEVRCAGGLVLTINELDPAPEGSPSGADLAGDLLMSNLDKGVVSITAEVSTICRVGDGQWIAKTDDETYSAPNVIVATGARLRKLGVPGEDEFFGQGVSECADCDGPMFKNMETVVVGGGDSAFQEALALAHYARKVTIVMCSAGSRARADLQKKVADDPKLVLLPNTRVISIDGTPGSGVESVRLATNGESEKSIPCMGVFVFIGLIPNTEILPEDVRRDSAGAIVTNERFETESPGLWAIGAVRSGYSGMLTDAAAEASRVIEAMTQTGSPASR